MKKVRQILVAMFALGMMNIAQAQTVNVNGTLVGAPAGTQVTITGYGGSDVVLTSSTGSFAGGPYSANTTQGQIYISFTDCNNVVVSDSAFFSPPSPYTVNFGNIDYCPSGASCTADFSYTQQVTYDPLDSTIVISTGPVTINNLSTGSNLTYTWDFGDGSPTYTGVNFTHTYNSNGPFNLCLTVDNGSGCTDTYCDFVSVDSNGVINGKVIGFTIVMGDGSDNTTASINKNSLDSFSIYPNPASNMVNVNVSEVSIITIFDLNGKLLLTQQLDVIGDNVIDINNFNAGMYIVKIQSDNVNSTQKLLIK